jgi:hypothetical protein
MMHRSVYVCERQREREGGREMLERKGKISLATAEKTSMAISPSQAVKSNVY